MKTIEPGLTLQHFRQTYVKNFLEDYYLSVSRLWCCKTCRYPLSLSVAIVTVYECGPQGERLRKSEELEVPTLYCPTCEYACSHRYTEVNVPQDHAKLTALELIGYGFESFLHVRH
ncbi:MAG TPA: hypothetical protein VD928_01540 [Candidatus Paceibacterota bacterium]|nr:hypothetical protein [Candidatus Paceibacterota bacterium]